MKSMIRGFKCNSWVCLRTTPAGNIVVNRRKMIYAGSWSKRDHAIKFKHPVPKDYVRCGGEFSLELRVTAEPEWGGTYPILGVDIRCMRCGSTMGFGGLDVYDVQKLVAFALSDKEGRKLVQRTS